MRGDIGPLPPRVAGGMVALCAFLPRRFTLTCLVRSMIFLRETERAGLERGEESVALTAGTLSAAVCRALCAELRGTLGV